jgi:hypothetical protein
LMGHRVVRSVDGRCASPLVASETVSSAISGPDSRASVSARHNAADGGVVARRFGPADGVAPSQAGGAPFRKK